MASNPMRAAERVLRVCEALDGDPREARLELLHEIGSVVPFDAFAWLLTDPETHVGSAPVADVPCVDELPRLIRLKYLTPINRWTGLDGPAGLHQATGGRPESSLVWRELLSGYDVEDVLSTVFRDRFGCWGFLDLWRIAPSPAFTAGEAEFLEAVSRGVTTCLRRCQARTFDAIPPPPHRSGPLVLVVSAELEVRAQTRETEDYLRVLVPPAGDARAVPAGAYNVGAQLLAVEAGVDAHPASARVHLAGGRWLTLRASRFGPREPTAGGDIAVTIEPTPAAERTALFARSAGLTRRETELLLHVVTGSATREIAERMFLSVHTVQDHLKSIFAKTKAHNRRALVARATGT